MPCHLIAWASERICQYLETRTKAHIGADREGVLWVHGYLFEFCLEIFVFVPNLIGFHADNRPTPRRHLVSERLYLYERCTTG